MLFFSHSRQNKYVPYIFGNLFIINTSLLIFHSFSSGLFLIMYSLWTCSCLCVCVCVFLCFIYVVAICFVTNNRNVLLKLHISYLHLFYFIFHNYLFLKCVWVLCQCYYSCLLSMMLFIPLITALLQDELILHKWVCNYRLLSKIVKNPSLSKNVWNDVDC